jgi:hypothetical protein
MNTDDTGLSRRSFLKRSAAAGVTVAGWSTAAALLSGCPEDEPNAGRGEHRFATLNKLADTVLPAESGDGGEQARAFEVFFDPYYAMNGWLDEAVSELDSDCQYYYGKQFRYCSLAQRTESLAWLTQYNAPWYASDSQGKYRTIFQGLISMTKLAWLGAIVNGVGSQYVAFPGPTGGYTAAGGSTPAVGTASGNYYTDEVPASIPDNGKSSNYLTRWLHVSGTGTVRDLAATVIIEHTYIGDLKVILRSPAGTAFTLHDRQGGSAKDLHIVNRRVTAFDGQAAQGWWRLDVQDWAAYDTGSLTQWGLHITAR